MWLRVELEGVKKNDVPNESSRWVNDQSSNSMMDLFFCLVLHKLYIEKEKWNS